MPDNAGNKYYVPWHIHTQVTEFETNLLIWENIPQKGVKK
jgi:hypothetical protein